MDLTGTELGKIESIFSGSRNHSNGQQMPNERPSKELIVTPLLQIFSSFMESLPRELTHDISGLHPTRPPVDIADLHNISGCNICPHVGDSEYLSYMID